MPQALRADSIKEIKEKKVEFIHLWFTDVLGFLKSFTIDVAELETAMTEGMGFDGSRSRASARIEESDMIALPDRGRSRYCPGGEGRAGGHDVLRHHAPDGTYYDADPRTCFAATSRGCRPRLTRSSRPELEYYYLKNDQDPEVLDLGTYFDQTTRDLQIDLRMDTVRALKRFGIKVGTAT